MQKCVADNKTEKHAFKDTSHKPNGSSLKQNTFGVEQECQMLHIA